VFQILNDQGNAPKGEQIVYGTIVRLVSYTTKFNILASNQPGIGGQQDHTCLQLWRGFEAADISASQFYIKPRYSMRSEGDPVYTNDHIMLESCRFRGDQVCAIRTATQPGIEHIVGLTGKIGDFGGLHVERIARSSALDLQLTTDNQSVETLRGGDFIRLFHQELRGYLISRGKPTAVAEQRRAVTRGRQRMMLTSDCH
jgi:hypothetical protein